MTIIIAGGGIGGLTAALALARIGVECEVFESVDELRPLGVGINLLPHAARELTLLGLADRLHAIGVETAELCYYSKHGQLIWQEPRGRAAGYEWPQYSIHRGRLQFMLLDAAKERLGAARVHAGHHLRDFAARDGKVVARFADRPDGAIRAEVAADALIGADGIHSVVRKHYYPREGMPVFSGRVLWRATTEWRPFLTGRSMIMAGHANQKFVAYPIDPRAGERGASLINWVAELKLDAGAEIMPRDWNRLADKASFLPRFRPWRFDWLDVPSVIEGAERVYEFPMIDRDPLARWSHDRVTLLGDAAHPMYPVGSNGASQAILDAGALAESFAAKGEAVAALAEYESRRREATSRIVLSNRQQGPERVMQLVEERAPDGFARIDDVVPLAERQAIAAAYKQIAGFDRDALNRRA